MDWSADGITQRLWVDLLDLDRNLVQRLDGVTGVQVSHKAGSVVRGTGQLDMVLPAGLDLLGFLARPWVEVSAGGQTESFPLMTGMIEVASHDRTPTGVRGPVQLLDLTARLDAVLGDGLSVPAGTVATTKIRELLGALGFTAPAITESSRTLPAARYWDAGSTWRAVINDLGGVVGHAAVWCDVWGTVQCHPYRLPADRPVAHEWAHGPRATFRARLGVESNEAEVPNHLVVIGTSEADAPPLTAERWDTDPASRWSTVSRGREIPRVESNVEAADQATLEEKADRLWVSARSVARTWTVGARWEPMQLGDVVRLVTGAAGEHQPVEVLGTVQGFEVKAQAGRPLDVVQVTLKELI